MDRLSSLSLSPVVAGASAASLKGTYRTHLGDAVLSSTTVPATRPLYDGTSNQAVEMAAYSILSKGSEHLVRIS
jgi:hypothetical protein